MRVVAALAVITIAFICANALPMGRVREQKVVPITPVPHAAAPHAPLIPTLFHGTYSAFALKVNTPLVPGVGQWISELTHLLDGEVWQSIDAGGALSIKTATHPTFLSSALIPDMMQTWDKGHGWTEKNGKCAKDATNDQIVIPGDIIVKTGVFRGTIRVTPLIPIKPPAAGADGTVVVDQWDCTLPNGSGTVTYYMSHGAASHLVMSHYHFTGKPPLYLQYTLVEPGPQSPSIFAQPPACANAK